jgi:hypothetical protein
MDELEESVEVTFPAELFGTALQGAAGASAVSMGLSAGALAAAGLNGESLFFLCTKP